MSNESFNPNLIDDEELAAIQAQEAADLEIANQREAEFNNLVNKQSEEKDSSNEQKEQPKPSSKPSSLDNLDYSGLEDDQIRIFAIKYLLQEFTELMTDIKLTRKEVTSLSNSLPNIPKVISNYCEFKKGEVTEDVQILEAKVATIQSILLKTLSDSVVLTSNELNTNISEAIARLDKATDDNILAFNKSIEEKAGSIKNFLNKNTLFVLTGTFFFQILVMGIFYILIMK